MISTPAIEGGKPESEHFLGLAVPTVGEAEISEVIDTLRSGWLTSGPKTERLEKRFAAYVGSAHALAVSSGTSALALSLEAAGIGSGDEVITTPMTWVATAHQIIRRGAKPVFVDIDKRTFNIDAGLVEAAVTRKTKALLPVHFAGRACNMATINTIAENSGLTVISDCAHAIETTFEGQGLSCLSDLSAYSFHPMKNMTTGEGGMVTTDNEAFSNRIKRLRFHGVDKTTHQKHAQHDAGDWDVLSIGDKAVMSDIQAAIGLHQLERLERNHSRRCRLAAAYRRLFQSVEMVTVPPAEESDSRHAWHMFNILLDIEKLAISREQFCAALKKENIGAGIHYYSLHRTSYYRRQFGYQPDDFPNSSFVSDRILTIPLHPGMEEQDCQTVVNAISKLIAYYA